MSESIDALLGLPYPTHVRVPWNVQSITVTTPPSVEPVDLATAKLHLRVIDTAQDALITAFITAARMYVESICQRALLNQTWTVTWDTFDTPLLLPGGKVASITSLTYLDVNGTLQTLMSPTGYVADLASIPARLFAPPHMDFPPTADQPATVTCAYTLGYGATAAAVPAPIFAAILLLIADMYENREASIPQSGYLPNPTVDNLLWPYRRIEP